MKSPKRSSLRRQLGKFIGSGDLLSLMLAVYLGESLGHFFNSLVSGAIMPLIAAVVTTFKGAVDKNHNKIHMSKWTADIHGAKIEYGLILGNFLQLAISVYIAYLFVRYFVRGYLNS